MGQVYHQKHDNSLSWNEATHLAKLHGERMPTLAEVKRLYGYYDGLRKKDLNEVNILDRYYMR